MKTQAPCWSSVEPQRPGAPGQRAEPEHDEAQREQHPPTPYRSLCARHEHGDAPGGLLGAFQLRTARPQPYRHGGPGAQYGERAEAGHQP